MRRSVPAGLGSSVRGANLGDERPSATHLVIDRARRDANCSTPEVPTGWPAKRIAHWDTLARARAIESQAWFVGVNAAGTHNGPEMGGHSVVIDPRGEVVHQSGQREEVAVVDSTSPRRPGWRGQFPALRDRRL